MTLEIHYNNDCFYVEGDSVSDCKQKAELELLNRGIDSNLAYAISVLKK
jgi:hypothetical protein